MTKKIVTTSALAIAMVLVPFMTGCDSDAGNSALIGSAIGAGVGQLAGGDTEATLIGAAIGGGAGYVVGNEAEKKETDREIANVRAEQNTETVWITNSNGSKISVKLTKQGPGYVGPRGEYYETLPTEDALKSVYGF